MEKANKSFLKAKAPFPSLFLEWQGAMLSGVLTEILLSLNLPTSWLQGDLFLSMKVF